MYNFSISLIASNTCDDIGVSSTNTFGIAAIGNPNQFYLAANDSDNNISIYDVNYSTNQLQFSPIAIDAKGSLSPALVNLQGIIYLFYRKDVKKSDGDDEQLYYQKLENGVWSTKTKPSGVRAKSDHTPSLLNYNGVLYLLNKENREHFIGEAWMNTNGEWASNDNVTYYDTHVHDIEWGWPLNQASIDDGKVEDDGSNKIFKRNQILTVTSEEYPYGVNPCQPRNVAATIYNGKIIIGFKGSTESSDNDAHQLYSMIRRDDGQWEQADKISNFHSKYAPSLVSIANSLVCIFSNSDDHGKLYCALYDFSSKTWGTASKINDDKLDNHKASDPLAEAVDNSTIAISYVSDDKTNLKLYHFQVEQS